VVVVVVNLLLVVAAALLPADVSDVALFSVANTGVAEQVVRAAREDENEGIRAAVPSLF
jgi:hypothetical protein